MNRLQKFFLKLARNALDRSSQNEDYRDDVLNAFDNAYGNLESSSADAFDNFSSTLQSGWSKFTSGLDNWWKGFTGSGLTERDKQLNAMNMQNVEDTAAAQVRGYQKAGINSALMYGNGASNSAPNSSSTGGSGSLSDLMQVIMLPQQLKMMQAQTKNIEANSQKTLADTEQVKLAIQYYPSLTENTIAEIISRTGLNIQNTSLAQVKQEIAEFEKIVKKSESEYADSYFDLRNQFTAAQTNEAMERAAEAAAREAWTSFETQWTKDHNGARPSSSALVGLIETLVTMFGAESNQKQQGIIVRAVDKVVSPQKFYENPTEFERNKNKPLPRLYMRARKALRGRGLVLD